MTIPASTRRMPAVATNGSLTNFTFDFKVFTTADVRVVWLNAAGISTDLVIGIDCTVTLNTDQDNNPGGLVTTIGASSPRPTGSITIIGDLEYQQGVDVPNAGPFFGDVVERGLDYLAVLIQQLEEKLRRAFVVNPADGPVGELPSATERASKFLAFDGTGAPIAASVSPGTVPVSTFGGTLVASVDAPAARTVLGAAPSASPTITGTLTAQGIINIRNTDLDIEKGGLLRLNPIEGDTGVLGLPGGGVELDINLSADGSFTSRRNLLRVLDNWDYNRILPGANLFPGQGFANGGQPYGSDTDWWFQNAQNIYFISKNNKRLGAWATCTVTAGVVNPPTLQLAGRGYNSAPAVTFIPTSGGSGATATTTITAGGVPLYYIAVTNGGSGYTAAPTVTISGGGGSGATAGAVVKGGIITGVHLFNKGTGYTSTPTVSFSGGGGSGAAATAFQDRVVTAIVPGVGGSGYTTAPFVQVAAGGNDQFDAGPTMLLARDMINPPVNSPCGNIAFTGRLTGSLGVDAIYAGLNAEILDPNPNDPRGRLGLATVSPGLFSTTENTNRMYIELGVYLGDDVGFAEGLDLGKKTLNADVLAADRVFAGTRAGGLPAGTYHSLSGDKATVQGEEILRVGFKNGVHQATTFYTANNPGWNAAAAAMKVASNSVTGRSLTAGGTVLGGGLDYAEYMRKRPDCGPIAKGDVCGVDNQGRLTDRWNRAHSFVIKSTNPSFVGGDDWAPEDPKRKMPEEEYEQRRAQVDRIAFSGQVPVNVLGATPGQFIIPVEGPNGTITGQASATNPGNAVGRVWNVLGDGRAWVKVL